MSIVFIKRLLITGFLLVAPGSLFVATINLIAELDGAQADAGAGSGSSGTGFASMTLDTDSNLFSWDISWSGLTGVETSAHFHGPALADQNAGVQVDIDISSNPTIGSAALDDAEVTDLLDGLWYINIHTDFAPSGEIRGQVQVIPVPAAFWLFGSGLIGLIGLSRRRGK